jgi:hypothetical protein
LPATLEFERDSSVPIGASDVAVRAFDTSAAPRHAIGRTSPEKG